MSKRTQRTSGATLASLLELDADLAAKGHPRVFGPGSWWRKQAAGFYNGDAREWWAQVGRGGIKSTALYRIAVNETLAGNWGVPPGERHWAVIKSKNKDEAGKALGILATYLTDLGVAHAPAGDTIELVDKPLGLRITAASVGANSGWRAYFDANDECAKWPFDGSQAVDAAEVFASGRAMTITHRAARRLYFSSALGVVGPHPERVAAGANAHTYISSAPTWIANPSITEADCRKLEADPRIFLREYGNIPQASALGALDPDSIERNMGRVLDVDESDPRNVGRSIVTIDASRGRKDTFAFAVSRQVRTRDGRHCVQVQHVDGVPKATNGGGYNFEAIVAKIATVARRFGARDVCGDQEQAPYMHSLFGKQGLQFHLLTWTNERKQKAVETLRRWLNEDGIAMPWHGFLKRELLSFEEKISNSGALTFGARGSGHDDYVATLVTLAMLDHLPEIGSGGASTGPAEAAIYAHGGRPPPDALRDRADLEWAHRAGQAHQIKTSVGCSGTQARNV